MVGGELLPFHVTDEHILLRLPTRSVVRLRSICKYWNRHISFVDFGERHGLEKRQQTRLEDTYAVTLERRGDVDLVMTMFASSSTNKQLELRLPVPSSLEFVCSYEGFLCFSSRDKTRLYLCNPVNREILNLDPSHRHRLHMFVLGIGWTTAVEGYKVVALLSDNPNAYHHHDAIQIVTCSTHSFEHHGIWKKTPLWPHHEELKDALFGGRGSRFGVPVNERLHWYATTKQVIVSFDLNTNQFQLVPIHKLKDQWPRPDGRSAPWVTVLIEFNGCLAFITETHRSRGFAIWTMDNYGDDNSWKMNMSFEHCRKIRKGKFALGWPKYCVPRDDDGELLVLFDNALVRYNHKGRRMSSTIIKQGHQLFLFVANLLTLHGARPFKISKTSKKVRLFEIIWDSLYY